MVKRVALPTVEELNDLFLYDPETGCLRWKVRRQGVNATMIAGFIINGYVAVRIDGALYMAHRIIWKMMTSDEPPEFLDHRDCDRSNNKWDNLRAASNSKNMMNAKLGRTNTSGIKGVSWHARGKKWIAQIKLNRQNYYLGLHETQNSAAIAVADARSRLHGEFARTN